MFATLTLTFGSDTVSFRVIANERMQSKIDAIIAAETAARGIAPDAISCQ